MCIVSHFAKRQAAAGPAAHKLHVVLGNEAADLDSIAAAMVLARHLSTPVRVCVLLNAR